MSGRVFGAGTIIGYGKMHIARAVTHYGWGTAYCGYQAVSRRVPIQDDDSRICRTCLRRAKERM